MMRTRLLSLLLLLAYLGVTPAGVYTCACFMPGETALPASAEWDGFPEHTATSHTAVASLLTYLSLSFLMVAAFHLAVRFNKWGLCLFLWRAPAEFKEIPPTPPPHLA